MTDETNPDGSDADGDSQVDPEPETLHGAPIVASHGQRVVHPHRDVYFEVVTALHADDHLMCIDLTAVDYLTHPGRHDLPSGVEPERFEVVVGFLHHRRHERVRLRVQVPESDPVLPSLWMLYPGTEAMEREVFDMFGISFTDHPDLTRILMPEDWIGHPLRKDYSSGRIPVQFKTGGRGGWGR